VDFFGRMALEFAEEHIPHCAPVFGCAGVFLVTRDVPLVPLAGEGVRVALCQRLRLAVPRGAKRSNPCLDLGSPLTDADLGLMRWRSRRHGEFGLPAGTVEPLVVRADVLRDALAYGYRAGVGVAGSDHAKRHLYCPFVLRAVQMSVCCSNFLILKRKMSRWCGREDSNLHGLPR
jgi:hypothetical protein